MLGSEFLSKRCNVFCYYRMKWMEHHRHFRNSRDQILAPRTIPPPLPNRALEGGLVSMLLGLLYGGLCH